MSNEFEDLLLSHLPSGPAWPKDRESAAQAVAELFSLPFISVSASIDVLLSTIDPLTSRSRLATWEAELGLQGNQSLPRAERQKKVREKFTGIPIFNMDYLKKSLKEITGKDVQIKELVPRGSGELTAGEPIEPDWDIHVIELRGFTVTKDIFYKLKNLSQGHILFIVIDAEKTQPIWGTFPQ